MTGGESDRGAVKSLVERGRWIGNNWSLSFPYKSWESSKETAGSRSVINKRKNSLTGTEVTGRTACYRVGMELEVCEVSEMDKSMAGRSVSGAWTQQIICFLCTYAVLQVTYYRLSQVQTGELGRYLAEPLEAFSGSYLQHCVTTEIWRENISSEMIHVW